MAQFVGYLNLTNANSTGSLTYTSNVYTSASSTTLTQWPPVQQHPPQMPQLQPVDVQPLGFNRYTNASDMLEEFIRFLGTEGVRQGEVMALPVELFIKWLIIRACEQDGEEPNVTLQLPAPKPQPRCLGCQRFLPAAMPIPIHDERCADFYFARQGQLRWRRKQAAA